MTALSAASNRERTDQTDTLIIPVAGGATIYPGGFVDSDFSGYAVAGEDAAYHACEGVAMHQCDANGTRVRTAGEVIDNSGGADGDIYVRVRRKGRFRFACTDTVTQAAMGCIVYVVDDNMVAVLDASVTHDVVCGRMAKMASASELWFDMDCGTHCARKDYGTVSSTSTAGA